MPRTALDAFLQNIQKDILHIGSSAIFSLEQVLRAIETQDQALYRQIIDADKTIDALRIKVERNALSTLTLQQPLAGYDLRFLSVAPFIVTSFERVGDNTAGIATLLLQMLSFPSQALEINKTSPQVLSENDIIIGIQELGQEALRVLRETVHAVVTQNATEARKMWQEDDVVDVRYHMVQNDCMHMLSAFHAVPALQQDETIMQRITYWLWIAHNFERIGDHCNTICKRIIFALENKRTIEPMQEN
jgi:phosphate transport system protein